MTDMPAEEKLPPIPSGQLPAAVEAILFASGDPVPVSKLLDITGHDIDSLQKVLAGVQEKYNDTESGLQLRQLENSYVISTKTEMKPYLERMFAPRQRAPLSPAAYETLSVIAYNQPVTRAQIEAVRGVNSDSLVSRLLERGWIRECGSLDGPGHPALFETTQQFLMEFGISSVKELPALELMMYSTIRDLETSLESAASGNVPGNGEPLVPEESLISRSGSVKELIPGAQQEIPVIIDEAFMGKD